MDEVNNDLEGGIDNLMNNLDTGLVFEESVGNELDSDDEPLNLLLPETNCHVTKHPTIEKTFEEDTSEPEKEVKGKSKEKGKGIKGKGKGKDKRKSKEKSKEKEIKPGEI